MITIKQATNLCVAQLDINPIKKDEIKNVVNIYNNILQINNFICNLIIFRD